MSGSVGRYDPVSDTITLWPQHKCQIWRRLISSRFWDLMRTRYITPDVGGRFGPKFLFYSEELVVALASKLWAGSAGRSRAFCRSGPRTRSILESRNRTRSRGTIPECADTLSATMVRTLRKASHCPTMLQRQYLGPIKYQIITCALGIH